jgi:hypothetical protein
LTIIPVSPLFIGPPSLISFGQSPHFSMAKNRKRAGKTNIPAVNDNGPRSARRALRTSLNRGTKERTF